jgi:hypothetical protein
MSLKYKLESLTRKCLVKTGILKLIAPQFALAVKLSTVMDECGERCHITTQHFGENRHGSYPATVTFKNGLEATFAEEDKRVYGKGVYGIYSIRDASGNALHIPMDSNKGELTLRRSLFHWVNPRIIGEENLVKALKQFSNFEIKTEQAGLAVAS